MGVPSPDEVVFTLGGEHICTQITAENDLILEPEETFTAQLSTNQERVIFPENEAVISIVDDEGRL